jgi:hypothetical protein
MQKPRNHYLKTKHWMMFAGWQLAGSLLGLAAQHVDQLSWMISAIMLLPGTALSFYLFIQTRWRGKQLAEMDNLRRGCRRERRPIRDHFFPEGKAGFEVDLAQTLPTPFGSLQLPPPYVSF